MDLDEGGSYGRPETAEHGTNIALLSKAAFDHQPLGGINIRVQTFQANPQKALAPHRALS
jgi:hypothetical protein